MVELNKLYLGDAAYVLQSFPNESIDLVVTSPPYSDLRKYGGIGNTWTEDKFQSIAKELFRVLKQGGVIVWVVGDKTESGSETGIPFKQALYFKELGLNINDTMIWQKSNSMPQVRQPRYNQDFEYMFVFSKGKPKTFNPIMVPCKCAGQLYDSTCKNMGGENGRTHKTFNINKEKVDSAIWNIAVAQNRDTKWHPAVFPVEIPLRHIKTWSNEGDIILDPFMGSGTTAIVANQLNRKYIGIEMNEEYYNLCSKRINNVK